jgi:hypothetical protein
MRIAPLLIFLALSLQATGFCITGFTPEVEVWKSELSGNVLGAGGAGRGTILADEDNALGFGGNLHILGFSSKLSYQPISFDTTLTVDANFTFDGKAYQTQDNLNLKFKWDSWDWAYRWGSFGGDMALMKLQVGLKVVDAGVNLSGTRLGGAVAPTVNFEETIPIPYLGFAGDIKLKDAWRFSSSFKYLDLSVADNDVSFLDFRVGLRYLINGKNNGKGSLLLGYRKQDLSVTASKGKADEAQLDFSLDGPVAAFQIHW